VKKKNEVKLAEKKMGLEDHLNQELIKKTVGVKDYEFAISLVSSGGSAIGSLSNQEEGLKAVMQSFRDLKPKDSMEARLIAQSAVLFEFAMKSFRQSGNADMLCHIEAMTNLGIKLIRIHNETVETLSRYRRGGEQKITVNHALLANQIVNNNYGEGGFPKNRGTPHVHKRMQRQSKNQWKYAMQKLCNAERTMPSPWREKQWRKNEGR